MSDEPQDPAGERPAREQKPGAGATPKTGAGPVASSLIATVLSALAAVGSVAFALRARRAGMSENTEEGCLTLLGFLPALGFGYLMGGVGLATGVTVALLGARRRSGLVFGLGVTAALAGLAAVIATSFMAYDSQHW